MTPRRERSLITGKTHLTPKNRPAREVTDTRSREDSPSTSSRVETSSSSSNSDPENRESIHAQIALMILSPFLVEKDLIDKCSLRLNIHSFIGVSLLCCISYKEFS